MNASAVSGSGALIPDTLANLKRWRFRPNAQRAVVVVHNFEFPCPGLNYESKDQRQFVLEAPNFATITDTRMSVQE